MYFLQLNFLTKRLAFQLMNLSFQIPYVCVLLTVSPSSKRNSLFIGPSVCVCVYAHTIDEIASPPPPPSPLPPPPLPNVISLPLGL